MVPSRKRSDTARYQHDLLKYCGKGENDRFGKIEFAIGCNGRKASARYGRI